jgi:hypothetical protein
MSSSMQASLNSASRDPEQRIKDLVDYGRTVEVDKTLALKHYFQTGRELLHTANKSCIEGDLERAFILYYKFITIFVEKVPLHPEYQHAPHDDIAHYKITAKKVFLITEEIKSKLTKKYTNEEHLYLEKQQILANESATERDERIALEEKKRRDEELARKLQENEKILVNWKHLKVLKKQTPASSISPTVQNGGGYRTGIQESALVAQQGRMLEAAAMNLTCY